MSPELDAFLQRQQSSTTKRAEIVTRNAATVSPEEAARRARWRREYGFEPPADQPPALPSSIAELRNSAARDPLVRDWVLKNPDNAAIMRGDMSRLADTSQAIQQVNKTDKSFLERMREAVEAIAPYGGLEGQTRGIAKLARGAQQITPQNAGRALLAGVQGTAAGIAGTAEALAELSSTVGPNTAARRALGFEDPDTGNQIAGFARKQRQGWERVSQITRPEATNSTVEAIYSGIESIPLSIGALAGGVYTKSATTAAALMGVSTGGRSYGQARDYGLSVQQSAAYGAIDAAIEIGTERLTFSRLIGDIGADLPFMKRLGKTLVAEGIGEQIATFGQDFNAWANIEVNEGKTFADFLAERPEAAYQTAIAAAVTAGSLTTAVAGVEYAAQRAGRKIGRVVRTEEQQQFLGTLSGLAKASQVLQRDAETFEQFIASAAEGTSATDVFVEAEQLQMVLDQSEITVDELFETTGLTPEGLADAVARGEDLAFPIEQFAARIAPSAISDQLIPHLRLDPDDLSQAQAQTFLQSAKEEFAADAERGAQEAEARSEREESRTRVEGAILADLQSARRFTDDVNEVYASVVGAFFDTMGARVGQTAEQLFEQYGLRVQSGEVAQPTYDQNADPFADVTGLLGRSDWAVMTAENPNAQQLSPEENAERNERLRERLRELGLSFREVRGKYGNEENSIAISGITREQAMALGAEFEQESVLTRDGLVYGDGTVNPATGVELVGEEQDDFYSTLDDGTRFAVGIDFDQRVPLALEQDIADARAGWTTGRILSLLHQYAVSHEPELTKSYVARIDPRDFIALTTPADAQAALRDEAGVLDFDRLEGEFQTPFLRVRDDGSGDFVVTGHEGRHRLSALARAGIDTVPVVIERSRADWSPMEARDSAFLGAQNYGGGTRGERGLFVRDLEPLSYANRAVIEEKYGRGSILFQSAVAIQQLPMGVEGTGPGGRVTKRDLGEALTLRQREQYGRELDLSSPEDFAVAVDAMFEDYQNQAEQPDNGEAWYSDDIAEAIRITTSIVPELADPINRDLFLTVAALLSPQQAPKANWENAIYAARGFFETEQLALRKPSGKQFGVKSHTTGLQLLQHLIDTKGLEEALLWVRSPQTGKAMAEARRDSGLFAEKPRLGMYTPNEMNLKTVAPGIYMMGPKVGDFAQNSVGIDQDAVTIDLWAMRAYGRLTGRLLNVSPKAAAEGELNDTPSGREERDLIKSLFRGAAERAGIAPSSMQAAMWYFEQRLYRNHGIRSSSQNFSGAAQAAAEKLGDGSAVQGGSLSGQQPASRDGEEGVRVYNQDGLNPLDTFKRESLFPTRAVRHEDGTVYADVPDYYPDRLAKIAEQIGASSVVGVKAGAKELNRGVPLWHNRPPVNADGTVTLHHWGPSGIASTDPSRWGASGTLPPSERNSQAAGALPRTYFGIASGQPGGYIIEFPGLNQYETRVPLDELYDITADPDKLKPAETTAELERKVKAAGYTGYWRNDNQLGLVAVVFQPLDVRPAGAQVLHQDAVFFSALERAIERNTTAKAPAAQWKATLAKTPGIKAEELEWTALTDFLDMVEGPVTREQLLEVVRGAGLRVDEVVLGGASEDQIKAQLRRENPDWSEDEIEQAVYDGDAEMLSGTEATQFSSWTTDPRNDSYRELLITLPIGEGRNPNRAPSTHWDTDGVVAHARFMDKEGPNGERILFVEEVQSDWHQKGRDQGYGETITPERLAELDRAYGAALEEQTAARKAMYDAYIAEGNDAIGVSFSDIAAYLNKQGTFALVERANRANLRAAEAVQAVNNARNPTGIPNAPFRTDWPALVMKRMIRWAAEHGYDQIAWTTGEQQAARYNLSQSVGNISAGRTGTEGVYRVEVANVQAERTLLGAGLGDAAVNGGLEMEEAQLREAFGNDIAQRLLDGIAADGVVDLQGDDLRVGGEGMKAFYDRNLPNIVGKLIKKYGSKVEVKQVDTPGGRVGIESEPNRTQQLGFDITPELRDVALGGLPLFQRERAPRGQIAFMPDITSAPSTITLLRGADLSTFVHELGHFFFEVTNHMASQAGAPAELVADRDAMLKYLGVESVTEWENRTPAQRREGHERMARSFETFAFEGKAPSLELRRLFGKLRQWMLQVYRTIARLDVELTDEVRGAFSRMLASDEAIAEAEADTELAPLFDDKPEGMSDADWAEYQDLNRDARAEASVQLSARSLRDMKFSGRAVAREIKRLQREVADQRAAVREEVMEEFELLPVYRAIAELRNKDSDAKLNTEMVREMLQLEDAPLPDALRGMTSKDGINPEQIAELFGFSSADHLLQELNFASPIDEAVDAETDQRMRERYGDLNTPEEVEEAARAAVHNEVRGRHVATELAALQNANGKKRVLAEAAKRLASDMIAALRIRDIQPGKYEAAERRAAKAARAAGTQDIDEAVRQKRNQLFNFNAAKAAHEAREEMRAARDYLRKFDNAGTRQNIDPDYLDQIDQLLERYELRIISNREADRRKGLSEWIEAQRAMGFEPALDAEALAEIGRKNWRDLTVEEMRGLLDAVKNVEHIGRLTKKLLTAKDKADLDTAAGEMGQAVRDNAYKTVPEIVGAKTWWERVKSGARDFFAIHRKVANMAHVFDGGYGGVFWERFVRPMNEAGDKETRMVQEANLRLAEVFKRIAREDTTTRKYIPEIDRSLSMEDRLMVALNWGNSANRQRIMDGDKWTPEQVDAILAPLEAHHWDFVENVWAEIDRFWPEIAAKERRVSGVEPQKVEAEPFQVEQDGELRLISGGYFPIRYDPDRSSKAEADQASEIQRQMTQGLYTRATTRRGHTKQRADQVNRAVQKSFSVIFQHVSQVTHDLAWHEYLIDANRLLRHGAVDSAIREHHGPEALRWIRKALEDIAIGEVGPQNAFESAVDHVRKGSSIAGMGWNLWTSLLQPVGLTQSMARIGTKHVMKGIGSLFQSPTKMNEKIEWVYSVSSFMRDRGDTMQREINEIRNRIAAKSPLQRGFDKIVPEGVSSAVAGSYFYMIAKAQLIADLPTWLGQYEKAMANGVDEASAVAQADQAVIDSQGGGQIKDLAGIQRGSPYLKLWTNFYSYFSATMNLAADRTAQLKRIGAKDLPYFLVDMSLLTILPATITSLMYTILRTDEDDPEEIVKTLAADNISYFAGMFIGTRELAAVVSDYGGYRGPAGARFFADAANLGEQARQGEVDEAAARALNSTAGVLLHYPAGQLDRTGRGLYHAINDEEATALERVQSATMGPPIE